METASSVQRQIVQYSFKGVRSTFPNRISNWLRGPEWFAFVMGHLDPHPDDVISFDRIFSIWKQVYQGCSPLEWQSPRDATSMGESCRRKISTGDLGYGNV